MTVKIDGIPELMAAFGRMSRRVDAGSRIATAAGAHLIEKKTKERLTTYSHKKGEPTPSPPGQPPALITGTLRRSIKVTGPMAAAGPYAYEAQIGPTVVYGRIQELGGVCGRNRATTLPARPYLTPAYNDVASSGELKRIFTAAWTAAIFG